MAPDLIIQDLLHKLHGAIVPLDKREEHVRSFCEGKKKKYFLDPIPRWFCNLLTAINSLILRGESPGYLYS